MPAGCAALGGGLGGSFFCAGAAGVDVELLVGAVCCAALLLGLTTFDSVAMWFVLIVLLGAALGVTEAGVLSISSSAAGGGLMTAQVVYAQAFAFGFLIGPPVATWLTTQFSLISSGVVVGLVLLLGAASGFLAPMPDQPGPIR